MKKPSDLTFEIMLSAAKENNQEFDGQFFVGVKSTKIFCLPSCKAKFPRLENLIFFSNKEEALEAGYRGCKRCRAESYPKKHPKWLEEIEFFMAQNLDRKITISEIQKFTTLDITTIRRIFKSYYGTSLMAYHRKLRLKYAKKLLEEGYNINFTLQKSGFQSINGFISAFENEFGISPRGK